jgi:hypothetical protein
MPKEITGPRLGSEGAAAKRIADASCGSVDCFRLQWPTSVGEAGCQAASSHTIWIETTTFLVRGIELDSAPAGTKATIDTITTYEPVLNQPVPGQALELGGNLIVSNLCV